MGSHPGPKTVSLAHHSDDFKMRTSDEMELLLKEATLGIPPTDTKPEALEAYERWVQQVQEIRDRGGIVEMPSKTPDLDEDEFDIAANFKLRSPS